MQVPRVARRAVAACLAVLVLAPPAHAATDQEVRESVTAGASWIRTQQNASTGQLTGFGGDYALSALAAAGVHPADVGSPSAQDYYAGQFAALTTPSSTGVLFGHAAGLDTQRLSASTNLVAGLAGAYNASGELEGSFGGGATNLTAFTALALARVGAPGSVLGKAQSVPARPAAHRRRLELRPRGDRRPARGGELGRHDRGRARGAVRDRRSRIRCRRPRRRLVPRRAAGPRDRRARERRLDRLGDVGPQRVRDPRRPLGHVGGADAARLPAVAAGPERRLPVQRLAEPVLDAERGPGAGRRGLLGRPAPPGGEHRPRAGGPSRRSPTGSRRRTRWRWTTARAACGSAA